MLNPAQRQDYEALPNVTTVDKKELVRTINSANKLAALLGIIGSDVDGVLSHREKRGPELETVTLTPEHFDNIIDVIDLAANLARTVTDSLVSLELGE